jgi:hypothetical protein
MAEKLTDRTAKTSNFADGDLVHIVDVSDTSQDPAGSSFKSTIGNIYGSYLAPKITSAQVLTDQATTLSVTLSDSISSNHYLLASTVGNVDWVSLTIVANSNPVDGAIFVLQITTDGGALVICGNSMGLGSKRGTYVSRYVASEGGWVTMYISLPINEFIELVDVPSSYTGQANKVIKVNAAANGLEFGSAIPKVYTALLTQTGTDAPVATVLENTLGGTVVWSYFGLGDYFATLSGVFTENKTWCIGGSQNPIGGAELVIIGRSNSNSIELIAPSGDGVLLDCCIEIRVYP